MFCFVICFVLYEVTLSFKFFNLPSKSTFLAKAAISFLLSKCACANLPATFYGVNVSNS